jgi:hypothetical protein
VSRARALGLDGCTKKDSSLRGDPSLGAQDDRTGTSLLSS